MGFFGRWGFSGGGSGEIRYAWKAWAQCYFASGKPGEAAPRKSASLAFPPPEMFLSQIFYKKRPRRKPNPAPNPARNASFHRLSRGLAQLSERGFTRKYNGLR